MVDTYKKVKQVLWVILFANLAVAVLKIIIGSAIKSASMTADGFHSLTDGSSNIIGLIGIRLASKPVDEDHPYGHNKFETLSGLFISGMLFILGSKIVLDSISRFISPVKPNITLESLIALVATLLVNIVVCSFELKQGKKLNSQILISDSMHTRSDIYISIGVLLTLISIRMGLPPIIDPLASLVVSAFIFLAGYEIFKSTSDVLVDRAVVDTDKIMKIAMSFEDVKDAHKIRSRGCENNLHIDMHIMTKPDLSVHESHDLIHAIEERICHELQQKVQVIIHIEPYPETIETKS